MSLKPCLMTKQRDNPSQPFIEATVRRHRLSDKAENLRNPYAFRFGFLKHLHIDILSYVLVLKNETHKATLGS